MAVNEDWVFVGEVMHQGNRIVRYRNTRKCGCVRELLACMPPRQANPIDEVLVGNAWAQVTHMNDMAIHEVTICKQHTWRASWWRRLFSRERG